MAVKNCYANIALVPGSGGKARRVRVPMIENFTTEQAIDNDVDSFSIAIGDVEGTLLDAINRDTEIRVDLFCNDKVGRVSQIFSGIVDIENFSTQKTHTMQGSDTPSAVLMATDALPGFWRFVTPAKFLAGRGKELGLNKLKIAPMKQIPRLWSDASEKEWAFWYRIARTGGCFMWSDDVGTLIVDVLNYSKTTYRYSFGHPKRGERPETWIAVQDANPTSNKQQRVERVTIYGEDKKKKGSVPLSTLDAPTPVSIKNWLRKPTSISVLTTARTQKDLDKEAKLEMFETIVGAQEYTLTVGDDEFIQQNEMARVNLPEYGIVGTFYIVGVSRSLQEGEGLVQEVRLREREYAVNTRVPTAPSLTQPNLAVGVSTANIAESISGKDGIRWAGAFVRATREFLSGPNTDGWDFSTALGVMLSICYVETKFRNVRERYEGTDDPEWFAMPTSLGNSVATTDPFTGDPYPALSSLLSGVTPNSLADLQQQWRKDFANAKENSLNPFASRSASSGEAGVGPMQLTSLNAKQEADSYGWQGGAPQGRPEYAGGRWNPVSNIRAGAHLLAEKLRAVGADPTNSETIWAGVAAWNGSGAAAKNYADRVRKVYQTMFQGVTATSIDTQQTPTGSAQYTFKDGDGNIIITLPSNTPKTVAKAITWAMGQRGNAYLYGGTGPSFDCSSYVDNAIAIGDPNLKVLVGSPRPGVHGLDTYQLRDAGTVVAKNDLLPGDLVFFFNWDHVGMYLGDGQFIQDPHTGDVVKISALGDPGYRDGYIGARRFFSWPGGSH